MKKNNLFLTSVSILSLLAASSCSMTRENKNTIDVSKDNKETEISTSNQAECEAKGGKWGKIGLSLKDECNFKTKDAGNTCQDSKECEGGCFATLSDEEWSQLSGSNKEIKTDGACSEMKITVGCHIEVEAGIGRYKCID